MQSRAQKTGSPCGSGAAEQEEDNLRGAYALANPFFRCRSRCFRKAATHREQIMSHGLTSVKYLEPITQVGIPVPARFGKAFLVVIIPVEQVLYADLKARSGIDREDDSQIHSRKS